MYANIILLYVELDHLERIVKKYGVENTINNDAMSSELQTISFLVNCICLICDFIVNICLFGQYAFSFDIRELIIVAIRKSINAINSRAR